VRLHPQSADAYRYRTDARINRKEYDLALADAEEVIRLAPKSPSAFSNRASIYRAMNDTDGELADLSTAIDVGKGQDVVGMSDWLVIPSVFNRRAKIYLERHQDERAFADFDEAVRLSPGFYLMERGDAKRDRGKYDDAIADYSALLLSSPKYDRALN